MSSEVTRRAFIGLGALAPWLMAMPAAPAQAAGNDAADDLDRAVDAYNRATIAGDVDALSRLVTDDYMLVNSDSSVQDKASYLADFRVPGFRLDPYRVEEPFRRIWGDGALTGGSMRLGWTLNGRHERRHLRFVHAWLRQDDRWRLAYSQLTRIPG